MKPLSLILVLTLVLLMSACGGSRGPAMGSPEWLWSAARASYTGGDFEKACDYLRRIEKQGDNPFAERARAWRLLIEAGSSSAQMETAKAYNEGSALAGTERTAYLRAREEHAKEARRHGIALVEGYGDLLKQISDKPVLLEFPFPAGTAANVADLDRVFKGMPVSEDVRASIDAKMVQRGVVRAVAAVLATEDDSATAQAAFKDNKAEAPSARYLLAMAVTLNRVSLAFDRKYLNEPDKQRLFQQNAKTVLARVLELKPDADTEKAAKKLQADIDEQLKERSKGKVSFWR